MIYHKIMINHTNIRARIDNNIVFLSIKDLCRLLNLNYKKTVRNKRIKENKRKFYYVNQQRVNAMIFLNEYDTYLWIKKTPMNNDKKKQLLEQFLIAVQQLKLKNIK